MNPEREVQEAYVLLGGTGGIGTALMERLVDRGAGVHLMARSVERLERRAEELGVSYSAGDASRFGDVERCLGQAVERWGRLDGVVNLVGSILLKPAHLTSQEEYAGVMRANVDTAFAAVRAGGQAMRAVGGSIVLVSSAAAAVGLMNHEAIAAAKAAVGGLARAAAATYARSGVRVNCVAPGLVDTPLSRAITGNPVTRKASVDLHALGRIGEPDDVAAAIDWLLGQDSSWVTGQTLGVDGGLATVRSRGAAR